MVLIESAVFYFCFMKVKIPIQIVEIDEDNFHLMIVSEFEDGMKSNWIIDTGASKTVFDSAKSEYFTKKEGQEDILSAGITEHPLKSGLAVLNPVFFRKYKIEKMKVALLDMAHINELYQKKVQLEISGLLGSDFLLKYKAEISYKKELLMLKI